MKKQLKRIFYIYSEASAAALLAVFALVEFGCAIYMDNNLMGWSIGGFGFILTLLALALVRQIFKWESEPIL